MRCGVVPAALAALFGKRLSDRQTLFCSKSGAHIAPRRRHTPTAMFSWSWMSKSVRHGHDEATRRGANVGVIQDHVRLLLNEYGDAGHRPIGGVGSGEAAAAGADSPHQGLARPRSRRTAPQQPPAAPRGLEHRLRAPNLLLRTPATGLEPVTQRLTAACSTN